MDGVVQKATFESPSSWLEQGDGRDILVGTWPTLLVLAETHERVLTSNSREVDLWSQDHRNQILTTIYTMKEGDSFICTLM